MSTNIRQTFIRDAKEKLIESILSIKVWIIFTYMWVSSALLLYDKLDGSSWATSNVSVISVVIGLREAFKVSKVKNQKNSDNKEIMI